MPDSPILTVLRAVDSLDLDAFASLFKPGARLLSTDGRVADGIEQVRVVLGDFVGELRSTTHVITAEWHPESDVWIAEVDATYELKDFGRHGPYPRAFILRGGTGGIDELRVYGLHELPLTASAPRYQEVAAGHRWLPTL